MSFAYSRTKLSYALSVTPDLFGNEFFIIAMCDLSFPFSSRSLYFIVTVESAEHPLNASELMY